MKKIEFIFLLALTACTVPTPPPQPAPVPTGCTGQVLVDTLYVREAPSSENERSQPTGALHRGDKVHGRVTKTGTEQWFRHSTGWSAAQIGNRQYIDWRCK